MTHLYWGKGKGKTTAAAGLALRALHAGKRVVLLRFLKSGVSGEAAELERLGACVLTAKSLHKFVSQMTEEEKERTCQEQTGCLKRALEMEPELLILDEACAAWQSGTVDRELLRRAVEQAPESRETVLTGREPAEWMFLAADYQTEMVCRRHPFEKGVRAREGVEY